MDSLLSRVKPMKQVVLVDNHPVVIEALKNRLMSTGEFEVVATVNHSDKAFFEVMERSPDLVLMEIELPGRGRPPSLSRLLSDSLRHILSSSPVMMQTSISTLLSRSVSLAMY